jgi:Scaffold protein Nfu/NifU N terminal
MGQFITVTVRTGASPSVRIFDLNRSLTGMAIERYASVDDVKQGGDRAPDVLARRLFDLGATTVTVYSSAVSVTAPAEEWDDLEPKVVETIEHLFGYYGDDAGWSPESLRAIGVEPLPTPEPTA